MPSSRDIRQQFMDFFVERAGHTVVPSAPVVPHDDPTLLFANAGMNQFKDVFLGTGSRAYRRAVDTQKCIRAGGKHNDLDDVGRDTYHHTFFEMLGNWSFGDYFKAEAIAWAWELLTDVWGLDPQRLHATYFEGDAGLDLAPDTEARDLWLKYLPPQRVHPGDRKDNFWEMGESGPCGPCSELHYDGTADLSGHALVNRDDPRVIEIWNLVFIQFNRRQSGLLEPLPAKHVDTGMGFERIVRVLQDKTSNYDTDVFTPLFEAIHEITGARPYDGGQGSLEDPTDIAYRVIADHIRTLTFALTDGAHCGNEGRSYVLRRILRRAVRYGRQTLGVAQPFFHKLVPAVTANFKDAFPELVKAEAAVTAEIRDEEESFGKTLDRGIALFEEAVEELDKGGEVSARDAFQLHDTYGFPLDLTQLMASERGLSVDVAGFNTLMDQARRTSRGTTAAAGDARQSLLELVQKGLDAGWFIQSNFTGHEAGEAPFQRNPVHLLKQDGDIYVSATSAQPGEQVALIFEMTPFYAESGGQVGDAGTILVRHHDPSSASQVVRIRIDDTIRIGQVHLHLGTITSGVFHVSDDAVTAAMAVDAERRARIMANHTATHLLNRALRDHVNAEVAQKGSLVDPDRLRFDFSHDAALSAEQIEAVQRQVNDDIAADLPVHTDYAAQEKAIAINGLRAVFGEKYPPTVRVVSIGASVHDLLAQPDNSDWAKLSIEFCGGTHLAHTGEAEGFVIVGQESASKGVRRITALTGEAAHQAAAEGDLLLHRARSLADAPADALGTEIESVNRAADDATLPLATRRRIREAVHDANEKLKTHQKQQGGMAQQAVIDHARAIADTQGGPVIVAQVEDADDKTLRAAMDVIRKKRPEAAMLLAAVSDGKVALLAAVPEAQVRAGFKAGDWIKAVAPIVGGGGGGRPDMAQAGGKNPANLPDALAAARQFAQERQ